MAPRGRRINRRFSAQRRQTHTSLKTTRFWLHRKPYQRPSSTQVSTQHRMLSSRPLAPRRKKLEDVIKSNREVPTLFLSRVQHWRQSGSFPLLPNAECKVMSLCGVSLPLPPPPHFLLIPLTSIMCSGGGGEPSF